jgi:signal transduction histidine kinase
VRFRLAALIAALFLAASAALLGIVYVLVDHSTRGVVFAERYIGGNGKPVVIRGSPSQLSALRTGVTTHLSAAELQRIQQLYDQAVHQRASDLHQLLVQSSIAIAVMAVIAVALGWFIAGRVLRPLRTMTASARRISERNLHQRLALDGPDDEMKDLAETIDDLLARLEKAFDAQRHFVANASHELRTPITYDRTLLEVALADPDATVGSLRATCEELLESSQGQEGLIEALLALASSERGLDRRERLDLSVICDTLLLRPDVDAARLELTIETSIRPAPLDGDRRLIERLVGNLVGNAITYNLAGGNIQIATGVEDRGAMLRVANTGPVIPPDQLDRLFQPFQRLDASRTDHGGGHGMGLSIIRAIADAHHATIESSAPPGGGLTVIVTFPPLSDDSTTTVHEHRSASPPPHPAGSKVRHGPLGRRRGEDHLPLIQDPAQ